MTHNIFKPIDRQGVEEEGSEPDRGSCDFCQTAITEDEEERRVGEIILCESCGSHYLD